MECFSKTPACLVKPIISPVVWVLSEFMRLFLTGWREASSDEQKGGGDIILSPLSSLVSAAFQLLKGRKPW